MARPSHERWWLQPPTIGAIAGLLAVLLLLVEEVMVGRAISPEGLLHAIYRAGQLISLNQNDAGMETFPTPAARHVATAAQMLAVVAVAMLGFEIFRLLGGSAYERMRILLRRAWPGERVMVIGTGPAAEAVVEGVLHRASLAHRRALVTHLRTGGRGSDAVHPLGALMVMHPREIGARTLRQADMAGMDHVIVAGDGDAGNLAIAAHCVRAAQVRPVRISVQIDSPECAAQVRHMGGLGGHGAQLQVFCPDRIAACTAVRALRASASGEGATRLLCVGFGASASAFMCEWLAGAVPEGEVAEVVAIDPHASRAADRLRANFPSACSRGQVHPIEAHCHPELLRSEIERLVRQAEDDVHIVVSVGDVDRNLSIALQAASMVRSLAPRPDRVTVLLRQSLLHDIGALLGRQDGAGPRLRVWGGIEESFQIDAVLDPAESK
jgi:hypothetical protein